MEAQSNLAPPATVDIGLAVSPWDALSPASALAIHSFLPPFCSAANVMFQRIHKSQGFQGLERCGWIRILCNDAIIIVPSKGNILPSLDGVVSPYWDSWVFVTECYHCILFLRRFLSVTGSPHLWILHPQIQASAVNAESADMEGHEFGICRDSWNQSIRDTGKWLYISAVPYDRKTFRKQEWVLCICKEGLLWSSDRQNWYFISLTMLCFSPSGCWEVIA